LGLGCASFKPHFFRTIHCQRCRWDVSTGRAIQYEEEEWNGGTFHDSAGDVECDWCCCDYVARRRRRKGNSRTALGPSPSPSSGQQVSDTRPIWFLLLPSTAYTPVNRMRGIVDCLSPALFKKSVFFHSRLGICISQCSSCPHGAIAFFAPAPEKWPEQREYVGCPQRNRKERRN
jgi:hypothetical protein